MTDEMKWIAVFVGWSTYMFAAGFGFACALIQAGVYTLPPT